MFGGFLVAATWTLLAIAGLLAIEARSPQGERKINPVSTARALGPVGAALAGGTLLAMIAVASRPHAAVTYADEHKVFIVGALAIAAPGFAISTAIVLTLTLLAIPARLPQRLIAAVGAPAEDEQQVRQPVQVADHLRVQLIAAGNREPLRAPAHGPADV